jgi:hypothetical protein
MARAELGTKLQRQVSRRGNVEQNAKVLFRISVGYNNEFLG